jgi:hypothetical protein
MPANDERAKQLLLLSFVGFWRGIWGTWTWDSLLAAARKKLVMNSLTCHSACYFNSLFRPFHR